MISQKDIADEKDEKVDEKDELCLYIESSNDRAYVLHLGKESDNDRQINILCESTTAEDELLKIKGKSKLISYKGSRYDKHVHIDSFDCGKDITIKLEDDKNNDNENKEQTQKEESHSDSPGEESANKLKIEEDGEFIILKSSTGEKTETYRINIMYGDYIGSLQIECVPQELIYDVVLDFGSEASQMLIQNRNYQIPAEPVRLFSNIAKHFYDIPYTNNNEYDQQEESDERLFRSVFFMKKNEGNEKVSVKQIVSPPSKEPSKDYILFVSKREENDKSEKKENDKGEKIPNVKISYLSGGWNLPVPIRDIHGAIVMRFIHEAMAYIAEERRHAVAEHADGGLDLPIAASVTLLIPNVMSQHEVSSLVKRIQRYVTQAEFREQLPKGLRYSIIEIRTCSESDASLKNWVYRQKNSFRPGKYLIIDIGKGTTDFSIVEAKNAQKGESIFRTGFVGAGNAISYAIFNNYITQLTLVNNSSELKERRKMLMERMLSASPENLYRLEQVIEKKKREESDERKRIERIDDYQEATVEEIIKRIDRSPSIDDSFGLVSDTISRIILEILKRVTGLEINFVVLCGRAFLYKPLREEMERWLTTLSRSPRFSLFHQNKLFKCEIKKENIFFEEKIAKNGCLNCTIDKMKISKSSNMVGFPIIVDRSKVEKDVSEARRAIEYINADKELRNSREKQLEYMREVLSKAGFGKAFSEGLKAIGLIDDDESDNESTNSTMKIMNGEFSVTTYGGNTGIYISDNLYVPVEKEVKDKKDNQKYDIFFDGEEFWLRDENSCIKLRRSSSVSEESQLEKESLFPYIRIKDITLNDPKARKK